MAKRFGCFIKEARANIKELDAESAHDALAEGDILVVDVREPDEFAQGHLPGAINIPRGIIEAAADASTHYRHPQLSVAHQRKVLMCCTSGSRSALTVYALQQMGFEQIYSLAGGLECWSAEGFELER